MPAARSTASRAGEAEASTTRTDQTLLACRGATNISAMRMGLVGTGFWARTTHAPAIAAAPDTTLDGVGGRAPVAAATLASEFGATAHQDFDAFLAGVDAVAFSVPPHVQAPLAIRAARA